MRRKCSKYAGSLGWPAARGQLGSCCLGWRMANQLIYFRVQRELSLRSYPTLIIYHLSVKVAS